MPVTDFECQIARGQIGRYLGGGPLSPEALRGLEEHLGECPGCKCLVAERRATLLGSLGGEVPTRAVVSMPVENPLVAALRARSEKAVEDPKPEVAPRYEKGGKPNPLLGKPLILAAVLAVVLVAMSYVSRATGGKGALGTKAEAIFAADTLSEPKAAPTKVVAPKPVALPKPSPSTAKPTPIAPKPIVQPPVAATKRVIPKRRVVRKRTRRPAAPATVRVYGLDGQILKP